MLIALGLAAVLATLLAGRLGVSGGPRLRPATRVFAYAAILVATFTTQELLEGLLASGHPAGIEALFGHGGLVVLPLALLFGLLASLTVRGLEAVERRLGTATVAVPRPRAPAALGTPRPPHAALIERLPLAFGLARRKRPPPLGI